jgi:hypothetical protein
MRAASSRHHLRIGGAVRRRPSAHEVTAMDQGGAYRSGRRARGLRASAAIGVALAALWGGAEARAAVPAPEMPVGWPVILDVPTVLMMRSQDYGRCVLRWGRDYPTAKGVVPIPDCGEALGEPELRFSDLSEDDLEEVVFLVGPPQEEVASVLPLVPVLTARPGGGQESILIPNTRTALGGAPGFPGTGGGGGGSGRGGGAVPATSIALAGDPTEPTRGRTRETPTPETPIRRTPGGTPPPTPEGPGPGDQVTPPGGGTPPEQTTAQPPIVPLPPAGALMLAILALPLLRRIGRRAT